MAVTVTSIAAATDTTATSVDSGAFTCTGGSMLVVVGYYKSDAAFPAFTTPSGFTVGPGGLIVSPYDSDVLNTRLYYKVAAGTETEVTLAVASSVDSIGVGVLEVAGLASAVVKDYVSASGSGTPIIHSAMAAGDVAIRVVRFAGIYNASQVDVPTYFSAVAPDSVTTHTAIRTSYRVTTNAVATFNDTITVGTWNTMGLVLGSGPSAVGSASVMFGVDF